MITAAGAQAFVDAFAAVALACSVAAGGPTKDPHPGRARLTFALSGLCLFYGLRAASEASGAPVLRLFSLLAVCPLPIAALALAEGMLRRHAPKALKLAVVGAGLASAAVVLAADGRRLARVWFLGAYAIGSLAAIAVVILRRDRTELSRQENAALVSSLSVSLLLIPVVLTDFLPGMPLGLSGLGAATAAIVLRSSTYTGRDARNAYAVPATACLLAIIAAVVLSNQLGAQRLVDAVRLAAMLTALLLAAGAILRSVDRGGARSARGLLKTLARADVSDGERFLGDLAAEPCVAGLSIVEGRALADYDADRLVAALGRGPVTVRPGSVERARDEQDLIDLLRRAQATHALMLSRRPLRIGLLTLSAGSSKDDLQLALSLVQKLAVLAFEKAPCA